MSGSWTLPKNILKIIETLFEVLSTPFGWDHAHPERFSSKLFWRGGWFLLNYFRWVLLAHSHILNLLDDPKSIFKLWRSFWGGPLRPLKAGVMFRVWSCNSCMSWSHFAKTTFGSLSRNSNKQQVMLRWQSGPGPPNFPMSHVWTCTLFTAGGTTDSPIVSGKPEGFSVGNEGGGINIIQL